MKTCILVSLMFCFSHNLLAQITHLTPEPGIFSSYSSNVSYYVELEQSLISELPTDLYIRILYTSTENPEYVLSIDKDHGRYMLNYRSLTNNAGAKYLNDDEFVVMYSSESNSVELGSNITSKLYDLLTAAISQVKFSDDTNDLRPKETYTFMIEIDNTVRSGCVSPGNIDENLKELIEITNCLKDIGATSNFDIKESCAESIDSLIKKFK